MAMIITAALAILAACSARSANAAAPNIVLFGDSLSDNGNGYAGNAKFVLRTNQVIAHARLPSRMHRVGGVGHMPCHVGYQTEPFM